MKTIKVEIRGTTPLLIQRFGEAAELPGTHRPAMVVEADPRETARKAAYIAADGSFYFNAFAIPAAMGSAGSNHKMKGTRRTARFVVPSAIRMTSDTITILNGHGPATDFEVDSRPVTIPSTKGRVMRHRPRFNEWGRRLRPDCQRCLDDRRVGAPTASGSRPAKWDRRLPSREARAFWDFSGDSI